MSGNANSGGHNRKGEKAHILAGTFRPDRHAGNETIDPPKGTPIPPKPLLVEARNEWNRMVKRLQEAGTLSIVDDAALYQYVNLFAETEQIKRDQAENRRFSEELKKAAMKLEAQYLVDAVGQIVRLRLDLSKQTMQLRQQRMAIRQYLVEFGMTPSARGRVKVPKEKQARNINKERFFGAAGA